MVWKLHILHKFQTLLIYFIAISYVRLDKFKSSYKQTFVLKKLYNVPKKTIRRF